MKKGYLSSFHQGSLSGISDVLTYMAERVGERGTNSDAIFYAAAFQAGIDEFVVSNPVTTSSTFIASRTISFSNKRSSSNYKIIESAFSGYLPDDWRTSFEFHPVICTAIFLNDLMDAMSAGGSLLCTSRVPDPVEIKELMPSELFLPLAHLFSTFKAVQTPSPIAQKTISTDEVQKLNDILSSDLFRNYVNSQALLDDSDTPIERTLPLIVSNGRMLFSQNRKLLALRNASVNILQMTPKLIDAAFGKLPGALAELAAKLGISFLEARRRLVIYDFHELMIEEVLIQNLERLLQKLIKSEQA
jgi:hypothetical protein